MARNKEGKQPLCPLEYGLDIFNGKWKTRIICLLGASGTLRYKEIRDNLDGLTDAVLAATLASLSVMWLPFILMIYISRYLLTHKDSRVVKDIFAALRPTIIGLIAAAAILLMNKENFGSVSESPTTFYVSVALFLFAFCFTHFRKTNPILILLVSGAIGLAIY